MTSANRWDNILLWLPKLHTATYWKFVFFHFCTWSERFDDAKLMQFDKLISIFKKMTSANCWDNILIWLPKMHTSILIQN